MKPDYPVILRNATVVDGSGRACRRMDVCIANGKITALGENLPLPTEGREVHLDGLYVSPGWMDLHTHVFSDYGVFSVDPSDIGLRCGVTTLVDAGSAGALNYTLFERDTLSRARESIYAYVNVVSAGLLHGHAAVPGFVGDHCDPRLHSDRLAKALLDTHADSIVGWKARLTAVLADGNTDREDNALATLLRLRDETNLPVMVHHIASNVPTDKLMSSLRTGDVYTHLYHGRSDSIFDPESGAPSPEALRARDRGVWFDVGHGVGAFRWQCVERACQQHGFWPDCISSDLHAYNLFWPVCDLATTMSRFLYLGLSLEQVIACVTANVARVIGKRNGSGMLQLGEVADLTVFDVKQGSFEMADSTGEMRTGSQRIVPVACFKSGELSACYGIYNHERQHVLAPQLQVAAAIGAP